jgi:tetratricopeptide (TPR) repeat protein
LWIRFRITGGFQGGQSFELLNNPFLTLDSGNYRLMSWAEKAALISLTLGKYLQLMVFPYPLSHDYYPMVFSHQGWTVLAPWMAMISNVFLFVFGGYGLWRKKIWGYGILFYFITLSIVSNVFFPVGTNMSERFIFMPSLGLIFLLSNFKRPVWIGITVIFSILTFIRNFDWKDNLTLFSRDIKVSSRSAKLNNALGGVLIENAIKNTPFNQSELKKAELYLDKAIQIHPTYKNAFLLKGNAAFYLSDFEKAISTYRLALAIDPNYEEARGNLGLAYRDAGRNFGEKLGNIPKAKEFLILAHDILPKDYEVLRLLGVAEGISGNSIEALKWFEKAIEIRPEDAYANLNLATAYFNLGQAEKGTFYLEKAKMINPSIISGSR